MKSFYEYLGEQSPKQEGMNATNIVHPSFLMCPPFNLYAGNQNNVFMKKYAKDGEVDRKKSMNQFLGVYNFLASQSLTYLIPHDYRLQDQSFTANLGIVLPHWKDGNTVVVSEFRSNPRVGEQKPGIDLFNSLQLDVDIAPKYFEGEADLKYFNGNNYVGAYGIRTSIDALNWFERKYDMNIVKVENYDKKMYHLDCLIYPLYSNVALCYTKLDYSYYVVQIADFDVNMILHFNTKQKHQYFQGERFSFVRWGSQCDIILPLREDLNIQPLIKKDFHVEAGVDKVASL